MIVRILGAAALIALAACNQTATDESNAGVDNEVDAVEAPSADIGTVPPADGAGADPGEADEGDDTGGGNDTDDADGGNDADDAGSELPPTTLIPTQYRGRWGLTADDCDRSRRDNEGLMTIRATTIRFYESVASLQERRPAIATSFSGVYVFEGEGRTWERVITLTRTGDMLKRAQADGSFTYRRCG